MKSEIEQIEEMIKKRSNQILKIESEVESLRGLLQTFGKKGVQYTVQDMPKSVHHNVHKKRKYKKRDSVPQKSVQKVKISQWQKKDNQKEMIQFLRDNAESMNNQELCNKINEKFGRSMKPSSMAVLLSVNKIKRKTKPKNQKVTGFIRGTTRKGKEYISKKKTQKEEIKELVLKYADEDPEKIREKLVQKLNIFLSEDTIKDLLKKDHKEEVRERIEIEDDKPDNREVMDEFFDEGEEE